MIKWWIRLTAYSNRCFCHKITITVIENDGMVFQFYFCPVIMAFANIAHGLRQTLAEPVILR